MAYNQKISMEIEDNLEENNSESKNDMLLNLDEKLNIGSMMMTDIFFGKTS